MDLRDLRRSVASSAVLGCLDEADRERLLDRGRRRSYPPRAALFHKGDPGSFMAVVLQGCVRIRVSSAEGREMVLNMIEPGHVVGEIAVVDGQPRTADAVAVERVEALAIDRREVLRLLEERPRAALQLLQVVCSKLRRTSGQAEAIAFMELPARLAALLVNLLDDYGEPTPHGVRIARHLPQRDLARLIASTRESVNRQLRLWVQEGLVACDDGVVTVLDEPALRDLAE